MVIYRCSIKGHYCYFLGCCCLTKKKEAVLMLDSLFFFNPTKAYSAFTKRFVITVPPMLNLTM
jgi:hypothetical protein